MEQVRERERESATLRARERARQSDTRTERKRVAAEFWFGLRHDSRRRYIHIEVSPEGGRSLRRYPFV